MTSNPPLTAATGAEAILEGYELSPQQARLWQWQQSNGGTPARAELCVRVPGDTDRARLLDSLNQLGDCHEILRSRYPQLPGMKLPVQVIDPHSTLRPEIQEQPNGDLLIRLTLPAVNIDSARLWQLAAQWAALYSGDTPANPLQYADYAAWRHELIDSQPEARAFWETQLTALSPLPSLPLRRHFTTAASTMASARVALAAPPPQHQQWLTLADTLGVPAWVPALAAWITLLHQHSESERLSLGLDWQQRHADPESALGAALGLYSEPLPLTVDNLDQLNFVALCERLHQQCPALLEWHDYFPSNRVTGPVAASFTAAGFRFIDANAPTDVGTEALAACGWRVERLDSPTAPCQLLLELNATATGTALVLHYNSDLFSTEAIALIEDQLVSLLDDACRHPQRKLGELYARSAEERRRLEQTLSHATPLTEAQERCYRQIVNLPHLAACFSTRGEAAAPAVVGSSGALSYGQLEQQANHLAARLVTQGAGNGTRIGHFLSRDVNAIVAMLAIFKAGGVYVPVDPNYPAARIAYILDDSQTALLITQPDLMERLPDAWKAPERQLLMRAESHALAEQPAPASHLVESQPLKAPAIDPQQAAYLIYTSGSTGEPKGVLITHANALHSLAARNAFYTAPVRHFLLLSSFAFDSSIAGLFWTLAQGGCLHLTDESEQKDPARLANRIVQSGITHLLALPSLYQLLLQALASMRQGGANCPLTTAIVAGEACPQTLVDSHFDLLPHAHLFNEYGPTEAAVWSTVAECQRAPRASQVSIGRPIPYSRVHLLNGRLEPVARGLKGELYIGGPGVSPGYLQRPALTDEKFIDRQGERLYRTGDFGCLDEHGELLFLGRGDAQVKIRGHRIELGEIEVALRRVSGLESVVVLATTDLHGQGLLRAFIESGADPDTASLRQKLANQLPDYMIPSDIQVLLSLPRTANGKTDTQALLALPLRGQRAPYSAPQSAIEQTLATLWGELLQVDNIGRADNFFALGGHSLLVVRLVHRIHAALHAEVPVSRVFQHPTLAALAHHLERRVHQQNDLIVLQPGEPPHPPLFCLHQPSGDVWHYQPLVAGLSSAQPVYGIPLPAGCNGATTTLPQLASDYCEKIRALQPQGPYYLCGWSMGGLLALEMASQLEQTGQQVAFLALIDTTFKANDEPLPFERLLAFYRDELTEESLSRFATLPSEQLDNLRQQVNGMGKLEQCEHLLCQWSLSQELILKAAPEVVNFTFTSMRNGRQWVNAYSPSAVTSTVHAWWAEDTLVADPTLPNQWANTCGAPFRNQTIAGGHDDILGQASLHGQFRAALDQAQQQAVASCRPRICTEQETI
ncbi:MAG: amino acid adenylation domain-containing protein [Gammaproteobacteria bacterium]|nr:amino acid adenylation domain-containing protein [Gammaproteobacteria bacterium]